MKSRWKTYFLYVSLIVVGGSLLFFLIETVRTKNTGFETKTLWDWMELLIIPIVLAIGAFYLQRSERETEREIAKDRQQEAALQAYIDKISELLLEKKLLTTKNKDVQNVARTRTISIMRVLNKERNNLVIQFLREAKLITDENSILNDANMEDMKLQGLDLSYVHMSHASLQGANLEGARLFKANLLGARLHEANLTGAKLLAADLRGAIFSYVILIKANLSRSDLTDASLYSATLKKARLQATILENADMQIANLEQADLLGAKLKGADLTNAIFEGAKLDKAEITPEQLAFVKSLKNAIMPDGTKHE